MVKRNVTKYELFSDNEMVAFITPSLLPEDAENLRLIAAAPELLEALIWMVENDETCEGDEPLRDHHGLTWNEINAEFIAGLNKARAAIAKATQP
jgi:hypothetical protein